jgi:hypothetical protein
MAAAQLRSQLAQSTGAFTDAVAALGYSARTTQPLNRTEGIDPVGCPPETVARLFAFPVKSLVVAPCDIGSLLVCPLKIYDADEALMYAEIDDYRERLARQAQALLFNMWFASAAGSVRVVEQLYQPGTDELENR